MVNIVFMVFMLVLASCSSFVIPLEKTGPPGCVDLAEGTADAAGHGIVFHECTIFLYTSRDSVPSEWISMFFNLFVLSHPIEYIELLVCPRLIL